MKLVPITEEDNSRGECRIFLTKILTWNFRGLGNKDKRRVIKELLRKVNLDLVVLQETKIGKN